MSQGWRGRTTIIISKQKQSMLYKKESQNKTNCDLLTFLTFDLFYKELCFLYIKFFFLSLPLSLVVTLSQTFSLIDFERW